MSLLFQASHTVLVLNACILALKQPWRGAAAALQADSITEAAFGALRLRGRCGWDWWPDHVEAPCACGPSAALGPH